jgi:ABC-2 type transport system permease protein
VKGFLTLTRRELAGYFLSLTGYILLAGTLFLIGFSFVVLMISLQQEPTLMPITEIFYNTQLFWLILLLGAPVITMRLFALEKFSFETLMTAPVSERQVVLAKFSAAMLFYLVMWLPLIGCLLVVRHYTSDTSPLDVGVLASTFLGILLLGGVFVSVGACASALTRSQVTAAMISVAFGASLFLIGVLAHQVPTQSSWQAKVLTYLSVFEHMRDFARGIVDTRPVVLFLSITLFFLFLTLRIVESRRWK